MTSLPLSCNERKSVNDIREKLESLDALNSWVRSKSFYGPLNTPRKRIYEAKRMALNDATRLLGAKHYRIEVPTKCRDCGGTGKYEDSWGRKFDHCYRCCSAGQVRLEFIESHLTENICWHTPRERAYELWNAADSELSWASSDWGGPNQAGRDLTPDEAAKHLLVIDQAWPVRYPNSHGHCFEHCDCTDRYSLYLGRWNHYCAHCKGLEPKYGFHKRVGRVEFMLEACKECYEKRPGLELFDAPMPWEMIQPPNIMAWVNANKALVWDGRAA